MATEQQLINARALMEYTRNQKSRTVDCNDIARFPTVDAVEVVRCKDCKYYLTIHCTCDGCCISDDWYCADGERRTDNEKS